MKSLLRSTLRWARRVVKSIPQARRNGNSVSSPSDIRRRQRRSSRKNIMTPADKSILFATFAAAAAHQSRRFCDYTMLRMSLNAGHVRL